MGTRVTGIPICSLAAGKSFKELKGTIYFNRIIGKLNLLLALFQVKADKPFDAPMVVCSTVTSLITNT